MEDLPVAGSTRTVFFDDQENDLLVGAVPGMEEFNYFGYLKKMALTLHNIIMMKRARMPYHGAMFQLIIKGRGSYTFMVLGDTGAGKSETLEALRILGSEDVEDLIIIADDMGSLQINDQGEVIGYGTETGAFVRLDDLQPGYAFGQIDRAIFLNPTGTNARVVIPVTTYDNVIKGFKLDFILYANNYDPVDDDHPVLQRFGSAEEAIAVFRSGAVMSKGTTNTKGLVSTYFANIFGPQQYQEMHEEIAAKFFQAFFKQGIYVGQMRTQLGIHGKERTGPERAAKALLAILTKMNYWNFLHTDE
jgi:hypothetical protein